MPVNDTTANKAYPKPNIANTLADDVGRLRTALDEIDADIAACSVAGQAVTVPAGSASAPSVSFTGDTNTGVFSPGGNQVALTTDGSTRLHVGSTGYIGVGSAPNDAANVLVYDATAPIVQFGNSTTGSTASDGTLVYQSGNNFEIFNQEAGSVTISTNSTQRLLIDASGNVNIDSNTFYVDATNNRVGIGTSGPGTALDVNGAIRSNDIFTLFKNNSDALYIGAGTIITGGASTDVAFRSNQNGSILFSTNGATERMRLDASGRLGIGTASPNASSKLHVAGGDVLISQPSGYASLFFNGIGVDTTRAGAIKKNYDSPFDLRIQGGNNASAAPICFDRADGFENARFDSSGRLLVGTSSARTNINSSVAPVLQVEGTSQNASSLSLTRSDASTSSNPPFIFLTSTGGTTVGSNALVVNNTLDTYFGAISFCGTDGTKPVVAAQIDARLDGTPGANDMPGRLVFSTTADGASSPTERMRITNNGKIGIANGGVIQQGSGIGGGSAAGVLELYNGGTGDTTLENTGAFPILFKTNGAARLKIDYRGIVYGYSTDAGYRQGLSNGAGTVYRFFSGAHSATGADGSGTESYRVWSNGNVENTNNSYGAISDIKLKENIVDAASQWSDIKALQVRKYNFKEGQTHTQIGLIAQEVELISPGLVSESPDRDEEGNDLGTVTKSVNYSVLYMKAVKALQEAMLRIEDLEARLDAANL